MKPMKISEELAVVVGKGPMPRSEVVKKLWVYIKKNNLQDPKNKRNINADAALKKSLAGRVRRQHVRNDEARLETPFLTYLDRSRENPAHTRDFYLRDFSERRDIKAAAERLAFKEFLRALRQIAARAQMRTAIHRIETGP
jgi:hypothetical protein